MIGNHDKGIVDRNVFFFCEERNHFKLGPVSFVPAFSVFLIIDVLLNRDSSACCRCIGSYSQ